MKQIPYGISNYNKIVSENLYYIDKTRYIEIIEGYGSPYLFFLRPRRFGKSLFLSVLKHYYDINEKQNFEKLFSNTYIGQNPTSLRNKYPILHFNFSMIKTSRNVDEIKSSFTSYIHQEMMSFIEKYQSLFSIGGELIQKLNDKVDIDIVRDFFVAVRNNNIPTYLLIDEYDNFVNNILVEHGRETYQALTHAGGFLRGFYTILKGLTDNQEIDRLFITGVSPLVMADVTSGFNVGDNISQDLGLSAMVGITQQELDEMVSYYNEFGIFDKPTEFILQDFNDWYNNYSFNENLEKVYNTVSILYYFNKALKDNKIPGNLIDENMRTDYGKFRFLLIEDSKLNGNFSVLKEITESGQTSGSFIRSFALNDIVDTDRFKSLLYYLGFLTFKEFNVFGNYTFAIPNKLINTLLWEFMQKSINDVYPLRINRDLLINAFSKMATDGDWKPALEHIIEKFYEAVSIRDFVFHEEGIKMFILAWLNMATHYKIYSEKEIERGYCDIFMEPEARYGSAIKYAYMFELKYIKSADAKNKSFAETGLKSSIVAAKDQLFNYPDFAGVITKRIIIVASAKKLLFLGEV